MVIQRLIEEQGHLKSPFEKGGFRGISGSYKSPLTPLLEKGGNKNGFSSILKGVFQQHARFFGRFAPSE
jgi:hypothetical protein